MGMMLRKHMNHTNLGSAFQPSPCRWIKIIPVGREAQEPPPEQGERDEEVAEDGDYQDGRKVEGLQGLPLF